MVVISAGGTPSRSSRRSVSVSFSPQSMRMRVTCDELRASTTRQLPLLPLARAAKRSNLLELLEEQREDAPRGPRAVRGAFLVEDVDFRSLRDRTHLHAI